MKTRWSLACVLVLSVACASSAPDSPAPSGALAPETAVDVTGGSVTGALVDANPAIIS